MPKSSEKKEKSSLAPIAIPAIVGAVATIAAAYFSYSAGVNTIKIPLNATQTAEARQQSTIQPTAIPIIGATPASNNQEIPIEQFSATVYVLEFFFDDTSQEAKAAVSNKLEIITGLETGIAYKQIFSFPDNTNGGGLYFKFSPELNILENEYQAVAFTINKDPQLDMDFILAGSGDNDDGYVNLSLDVYGVETGIKVNGGEFYIPLRKNFEDVSIVKWLYFWIRNDNTQVSGKIEFDVSNIRFIK